ncbi:lipoyl(octanoyl) transferase LipB [Mycobacterium sp. URHD0025]|uniref:lipoyl(octanoyl) transferase LipB n=1 Tax=Mycobacterium sp. URHD0025 TaxID=1298864 RepID=UPI0018C8EFFA|nr:lipoyl(octanoyl) transferase LipB [Mycobacterium sp. URHD0025]
MHTQPGRTVEAVTSIRASTAPVEVRHLGTIGYEAAWELQREIAEARVAGGPDTLLLLQHPAVYTAGKRTEAHERPADGTPVIDTDRGGKITWHGPGQLVGYPIIGLTEPLDVVNFVRRLEQALISVCADVGLATDRVEGRSGVWVGAAASRESGTDGLRPARKVGAIGIRVSRATTLHGFALNCDCDLSAFSSIVPCGISDAGVTSLTAELGRRITVEDVTDRVAAAVSDALDGRLEVALNVG